MSRQLILHPRAWCIVRLFRIVPSYFLHNIFLYFLFILHTILHNILTKLFELDGGHLNEQEAGLKEVAGEGKASPSSVLFLLGLRDG